MLRFTGLSFRALLVGVVTTLCVAEAARAGDWKEEADSDQVTLVAGAYFGDLARDADFLSANGVRFSAYSRPLPRKAPPNFEAFGEFLGLNDFKVHSLKAGNEFDDAATDVAAKFWGFSSPIKKGRSAPQTILLAKTHLKAALLMAANDTKSKSINLASGQGTGNTSLVLGYVERLGRQWVEVFLVATSPHWTVSKPRLPSGGRTSGYRKCTGHLTGEETE